MKTGLSIHGTAKRGITPTTRKKHGRHPFLSLPTATLSNRFHKFVCLKSLKSRERKRQDLSLFPPICTLITPLHLPHMEKATGCANCLGTTLECCRRQTCKPWLLPPPVNQSFYLHFICIPSASAQPHSARPCQLLLGLDIVPEVQPQTRAGNRSGTEITAGIPSPCWHFTTRSQPMEPPKEGWKAEASPTGNRKCAKLHWQSCAGAAQQQCCPHIPGISRLLHLHTATRGQTVYTRENRLVHPTQRTTLNRANDRKTFLCNPWVGAPKSNSDTLYIHVLQKEKMSFHLKQFSYSSVRAQISGSQHWSRTTIPTEPYQARKPHCCFPHTTDSAHNICSHLYN